MSFEGSKYIYSSFLYTLIMTLSMGKLYYMGKYMISMVNDIKYFKLKYCYLLVDKRKVIEKTIEFSDLFIDLVLSFLTYNL